MDYKEGILFQGIEVSKEPIKIKLKNRWYSESEKLGSNVSFLPDFKKFFIPFPSANILITKKDVDDYTIHFIIPSYKKIYTVVLYTHVFYNRISHVFDLPIDEKPHVYHHVDLCDQKIRVYLYCEEELRQTEYYLSDFCNYNYRKIKHTINRVLHEKLNCFRCGKLISNPDGKFCSYCGARTNFVSSK